MKPEENERSLLAMWWVLDAEGQPARPRSMDEVESCLRDHRARTVCRQWVGNVEVSTMFLGLDWLCAEGTPVLWETMTFSNVAEYDCAVQARCGGRRPEALAMHLRVCEAVAARLAEIKGK